MTTADPQPQPVAAKPQALPRSAYRAFRPITTRWMDNDVYGHVNNVVYYSWFDTAVNAHLIEQGVLDIHNGETIGGGGNAVQLLCAFGFPANHRSGHSRGASRQFKCSLRGGFVCSRRRTHCCARALCACLREQSHATPSALALSIYSSFGDPLMKELSTSQVSTQVADGNSVDAAILSRFFSARFFEQAR